MKTFWGGAGRNSDKGFSCSFAWGRGKKKENKGGDCIQSRIQWGTFWRGNSRRKRERRRGKNQLVGRNPRGMKPFVGKELGGKENIPGGVIERHLKRSPAQKPGEREAEIRLPGEWGEGRPERKDFTIRRIALKPSSFFSKKTRGDKKKPRGGLYKGRAKNPPPLTIVGGGSSGTRNEPF